MPAMTISGDNSTSDRNAYERDLNLRLRQTERSLRQRMIIESRNRSRGSIHYQHLPYHGENDNFMTKHQQLWPVDEDANEQPASVHDMGGGDSHNLHHHQLSRISSFPYPSYSYPYMSSRRRNRHQFARHQDTILPAQFGRDLDVLSSPNDYSSASSISGSNLHRTSTSGSSETTSGGYSLSSSSSSSDHVRPRHPPSSNEFLKDLVIRHGSSAQGGADDIAHKYHVLTRRIQRTKEILSSQTQTQKCSHRNTMRRVHSSDEVISMMVQMNLPEVTSSSDSVASSEQQDDWTYYSSWTSWWGTLTGGLGVVGPQQEDGNIQKNSSQLQSEAAPSSPKDRTSSAPMQYNKEAGTRGKAVLIPKRLSL